MAYLKDHRVWSKPHASKPERRQAWFQAFVHEAVRRGDAWVTSVPNADVCRIETTPGSPWVAELRSRGYPIEIDDPAEGHERRHPRDRSRQHRRINIAACRGQRRRQRQSITLVRCRFRAP